MDLISVIVPVYNSELFIDRCIESIIGQTYSCLEVILVDDGSVDKSYEKCVKWGKKDPRVKVVSQRNEGAAAARNAGIDLAQGDYVMFVDSDDYVSSDICQKLLDNAKHNQADLSICRMEKIEHGRVFATRQWDYHHNFVLFNRIELLKEYFLNKIDCGPCHKLYSRQVIQGVRFPVGRINEDFVFNYLAFSKSRLTVYSNEVLYHYCFREDSVTSSPFNEKSFDRYYNCVEMISYVRKNIPEVENEARYYLQLQSFYLMKEIAVNNRFMQYPEQTRKIEKTLKNEMPNVIKNNYFSWREKVSYLFITYAPHLYLKTH